MSEKSRAEQAKLALKGSSIVVGGLAHATGHPTIGDAAYAMAMAAEVFDLTRNDILESYREFLNNLFTTHDADKENIDDLKEKLRSKNGVKTTMAAMRALFDLIDDAAEPPLRRLTLDYATAGKRADSFYRGAATMLTHCDAGDIQDMRAVFGMVDLNHNHSVTVSLAKGTHRNIDSSGKGTMGMSGGNTIGTVSAASILQSVAVHDAARAMRLLDDHRITTPGTTRVTITTVPVGVLTGEHAWRLARAFRQT